MRWPGAAAGGRDVVPTPGELLEARGDELSAVGVEPGPVEVCDADPVPAVPALLVDGPDGVVAEAVLPGVTAALVSLEDVGAGAELPAEELPAVDAELPVLLDESVEVVVVVVIVAVEVVGNW